jgi:acetyl esterase
MRHMAMTLVEPLIPLPQPFGVTYEDIEYARHAGESLLARLYRPVGTQPIAAMVDVHGGAWVLGDRTTQRGLDQALAAHGVLVAAVDFRQPPGNPYPTSLVDVNLAIRWLKAHRAEYAVAPGAPIGAFGGSSGGHVVVLSGMRPRDSRYAALPLAGSEDLDASLDFVIADAPVTDPTQRLQTALREGKADFVERFRQYWPTDADALDGNPNQILARGEQAELPPLLITQGTDDRNVELRVTREFCDRYAAAGGTVRLHTFAGLGHGFILQEPARAESLQQAQLAIDFVREQVARA